MWDILIELKGVTKRGSLSGIKQIESITDDSIKFKKSKYSIKLNKLDYFKIEYEYKKLEIYMSREDISYPYE